MPGSAAVSRWFTASRGKALGIASMGTSLGGVIVPALLTWWVEVHGWRVAMQYLAYTAAFLLMPFIWLTVHSRPEDVGMKAEGMESTPAETVQAVQHSLGMAAIIRTRPFWLIALSMGMIFAAFSSIMANLAPYAAGLGNGDAAISTLIAVLAVGGMVGKWLFGTAADRINLKHGLWGAHALLLTAFLLMLAEISVNVFGSYFLSAH